MTIHFGSGPTRFNMSQRLLLYHSPQVCRDRSLRERSTTIDLHEGDVDAFNNLHHFLTTGHLSTPFSFSRPTSQRSHSEESQENRQSSVESYTILSPSPSSMYRPRHDWRILLNHGPRSDEHPVTPTEGSPETMMNYPDFPNTEGPLPTALTQRPRQGVQNPGPYMTVIRIFVYTVLVCTAALCFWYWVAWTEIS